MIRSLLNLIGRAHAQLAYNPFAKPRVPERQQPANMTYYSSWRERAPEQENAA